MNDKLQAMYKSGGLLKALLKDPAQRKMAEGMLKNMAMGGKMEYGSGGAMEYRMGGPIREVDMDKIQTRKDDDLRFEYVGEDYLQQNPSDIADAGNLLKYFTVSEAVRQLDDIDIDTRGLRPEKILKVAREKGLNPLRSARDLFDREMEMRKGAGSTEFEMDEDFRA